MTAGALYGARRTPRQSLGIAFGSLRNLGGKSMAAADSMASPRANGQRRKIACLAVQCVSLPRLAFSSFPRRAENRASHTKSPLKHRRQPDVLNDSGGVIRRSPNPAPKSRCCFWLFTESWGGQVHGSRITWHRQERTGKEEKLRVWQCNMSLCRALLSPAFREEWKTERLIPNPR